MAEKYGGWVIERPLGRGGQGTVSLARDTRGEMDAHTRNLELRAAVTSLGGALDEQGLKYNAERLVGLIQSVARSQRGVRGALKVLHPFDDPAAERKALERMDKELNALTSASHPALIRILDSRPSERWFVMEYFSSGSLDKHLKVTRGDVPGALRRLRPLVAAVATLHTDGIVHRDIKPENIFVADDGGLVLGDFGLAIRLDDAERLTDTYENVGSRDWMPPWTMGMRLDQVRPTFDVFGLGKVLWAMVAGRAKLRLWYHRRREFDLATMFPDSDLVPWVQQILDKTVVQEEEDCLRSANELLNHVDRAITAIESGGTVLAVTGPGICRMCGVDRYALIADRGPENAVVIFGIAPQESRSFKIYACPHCGHVVTFFLGAGPRPAWGEGSGAR